MGKHQVLQVTRSNLPRALEQIRGHIEQAHYVSISSKRTGAFRRPWHRLLPVDVPEVAYLKAKAAAESYELLQFAVCPFRIEGSQVLAFPYNFHLFPRDELNIGMPSYSFSCQRSFLSSMTHEGFDFNAWVYDGISYLSRAQELKAKLRYMPIIDPMQANYDLSFADKIFVERAISKVKDWKDACKGPSKDSEDALFTSLRRLILGSELYGSRPSLILDVCSSQQAQLIMKALSEMFDDIVPIVIQGRDGGAKAVRVVLANSEEDKILLLNELQNQQEEFNRKFCGFREVVDLISSSGKPVVGYDCLNEFTAIHSKFLAPLPPSMKEFISSLTAVFSNTLDVSHILKEIGPLRKANNLGEAVVYLQRQFLMPLEMKTPQVEESCKNLCKNLGNDVLRITHVFAKLCSIMEINPHFEDGQPKTSLERYRNIFFPCSTSIQELVEEDAEFWLGNASNLSTDHLVFIWGFRKGTSAALLKDLLGSSHASFSEDFRLKLVDKKCAVVIFTKPYLADAFLNDMKGGNNCSTPLMDLISNGLNAACYGVYKRIYAGGLPDGDLADLFDKSLIENKYDTGVDRTNEELNSPWPYDLITSLSDV